MKTLTIRLNNEDLKAIKNLTSYSKTDCISKNIRFALKHAKEYFELKEQVQTAIKHQLVISQEDIEKLQTEVGGF